MHRVRIFTVLYPLFMSLSLGAIVPQWDWPHLPLHELTLPALMGVAVSEYQVSGQELCPRSNWAHWEGKQMHNGRPTIQRNNWSKSSCKFWDRCTDDIALIKQLGCNSFRFSVEWSNIEPEEGVFCQEAMQHYVDFCVKLRAEGIEPMVTLHHFTHPQWFEAQGGFADEKNITYFVRFCSYVFTHLSPQVNLWCTINEIGPFVFQGYIQGVFPPGKRIGIWTGVLDILRALHVMRVMVLAHCAVYNALKKLPGGTDAQIGLVHQYLAFEPHTTSYISQALEGLGSTTLLHAALYGMTHVDQQPTSAKINYYAILSGLGLSAFNPLERVPALVMTYLFNDALLHFFKTGEIFPWIPGLRSVVPNGKDTYDFIGLNFYSRVVIESRVFDWVLSGCKGGLDTIARPYCRAGEVMTDMEYGVCPEGLYEAIKVMSQFKKPIYITENGIADRHDDRRALWIRRYLYAVSKAIRDGYDVRGYYYWSLLDNFEWDRGYDQRFGLYEVDRETQERTMRHSAQIYRDIILRSQGVLITQLQPSLPT